MSKEQSERRMRLEKRDSDLRAYYLKLSEKRLGKHRLYSEEAMIEMAAEKFYLSTSTAEDIIYNRAKYKSYE